MHCKLSTKFNVKSTFIRIITEIRTRPKWEVGENFLIVAIDAGVVSGTASNNICYFALPRASFLCVIVIVCYRR